LVRFVVLPLGVAVAVIVVVLPVLDPA